MWHFRNTKNLWRVILAIVIKFIIFHLLWLSRFVQISEPTIELVKEWFLAKLHTRHILDPLTMMPCEGS